MAIFTMDHNHSDEVDTEVKYTYINITGWKKRHGLDDTWQTVQVPDTPKMREALAKLVHSWELDDMAAALGVEGGDAPGEL